MRPLACVACLIGCAALAACAPLPDLAAGRAAPGPAAVLVPIEGILAQADAIGPAEEVTGPVDARAARLRAKAARLRSQ
ncbi:MAG: hypothetical protein JXR75_00870 [Rhodobacteraceae bacterium]|nr:hypothetical protein [Paracoccaceae bacterium]